jgi:hypothetical protein
VVDDRVLDHGLVARPNFTGGGQICSTPGLVSTRCMRRQSVLPAKPKLGPIANVIRRFACALFVMGTTWWRYTTQIS